MSLDKIKWICTWYWFKELDHPHRCETISYGALLKIGSICFLFSVFVIYVHLVHVSVRLCMWWINVLSIDACCLPWCLVDFQTKSSLLVSSSSFSCSATSCLVFHSERYFLHSLQKTNLNNWTHSQTIHSQLMVARYPDLITTKYNAVNFCSNREDLQTTSCKHVLPQQSHRLVMNMHCHRS